MTSNKSLKDMTDEELKNELHYWDGEVANATAWGASIAAADEFRRNIKSEIWLRADARHHRKLESSSLTKERTAMEDDLGIKMPYWTTLISEPRLSWLKAPSLHQKDGGNWMDAEPDIELASESLRQLTALKESFVVLNEKVLALITLIMTRF